MNELRAMASIGDALRFLSVAALGLFAGAMVTEGFVLVSFWRSLAPQDFLAWYAANDQRLVAFFRPLTVTATVLALVAAAVSLWSGHAGRWPALLAAALTLVVLATYFVYFEGVNATFSARTIDPAAVPAELQRWASWHWARTVMSVIAFAAGLATLRSGG